MLLCTVPVLSWAGLLWNLLWSLQSLWSLRFLLQQVVYHWTGQHGQEQSGGEKEEIVWEIHLCTLPTINAESQLLLRIKLWLIYICSLKNTTITCKESQVKQSLGRRRESDTLVRSFKQRSISKQGVTQTHRCNSQLVVFCSCCCMPLLFSCHIYYKMSKF